MAEWILNGAFTNMFREAKQWSGSPTLDANGWPTAGWPVQTSLVNNVGAANVRTGVHTVYFAGSGTINITGSATATITSSGQTFTVVTAVNSGIGITIASSSAPPNHVRDIAVVHANDLADYLAGESFTSLFKLSVSEVGSVIRFMDPFATNTSEHIDWAGRSTPTLYTQNSASGASVGSSTKGMCIELAVELCNKTGCDMWLNVPHRATDDYCTQLFAYVAANLSASRVCWVELSNEVWNSLFDRAAGDAGPTDNGQYTYFVTLANSLGLGGANNSEKRQRAYKRRAIEVFALAVTAFGGTSRLRRVLAGQRIARTILDYSLAFEPENNDKIDYLSVATYWGAAALISTQNPSGRKPLTLEDYFTDLDLVRPVSEAADAADVAYYSSTYGKQLVAYEGGLVSEIGTSGGWATDSALHALVNSAMGDSRMQERYRSWFANQKTSGLVLTNHYAMCYPFPAVGTSAGRWGLREHIYASDGASPKYVAMKNAKAGVG